MNPLTQAIAAYGSLVGELSREYSNQNFGAIGDPIFEGVRFYTLDHLARNFDCDMAVEIGSTKVDAIEETLREIDGEFSLFPHLLRQLKAVAPLFNRNGKAVFLGSWGMAPGEIAWCVRYLNDRAAFDRFLSDASLSEADVDVYDEAYVREMNRG